MVQLLRPMLISRHHSKLSPSQQNQSHVKSIHITSLQEIIPTSSQQHSDANSYTSQQSYFERSTNGGISRGIN
eukprot:scaffold28820_cov30-Cyclotella_meneghiniana.AAC.1